MPVKVKIAFFFFFLVALAFLIGMGLLYRFNPILFEAILISLGLIIFVVLMVLSIITILDWVDRRGR